MTQIPPSNDPNNPQPGYPPAGYVPPGYPPQGGFQPSQGYAPQPMMQPVEPATGSQVQAWAQTALPNRRTIASWAQTATQSWVTTSIIVAAIIGIIGSVLGNLPPYFANTTLRTTTNGVTTTAVTTVGLIIGRAISEAISVVGFVLVFGFFLALFMPATFGTLGARFQRALKPVALVIVSIEVVSILLSVVGGFIYTNIAPNLQKILDEVAKNPNNPDPNVIQGAFGPVVGLGSLLVLAGVLYAAYAIAQYVQSGSVGSTLNRWAVFGTVLLAAVVSGIISFVISLPLGFLR